MSQLQGEPTCKENSSNGKYLTIRKEYLLELIKNHDLLVNENNILKEENKTLKAENITLKKENTVLKLLDDYKTETDQKYKIIQVKLDKIIELNKNMLKPKAIEDISIYSNESSTDNFEFPISSKEQLDHLEEKLTDRNFEVILIKKFSKICGTSGIQKLSKIGLMVMKHIFKDEFLQQCTWKGIKGCSNSKTPFIQYIKTRELLYKVIKLADSSCSSVEVDSFLQNSAIKHSGQRLKRKCSGAKVTNPKKNKIETEKDATENKNHTITKSDKENTTENEGAFSNNLEIIYIANQEEINENVQDRILAKENKIGDTQDTYQKNNKIVTVLSDVETNNQIMDLKHERINDEYQF